MNDDTFGSFGIQSYFDDMGYAIEMAAEAIDASYGEEPLEVPEAYVEGGRPDGWDLPAQRKQVVGRVYIVRGTPEEGEIDGNARFYREEVDKLINEMMEAGLIADRAEIQFHIATNEEAMLTILRVAANNEAIIFIVSHGYPVDGDRYICGNKGPEDQIRARWNYLNSKKTGRDWVYLDPETCRFEGCNLQGTVCPDEVIQERIKPELENILKDD